LALLNWSSRLMVLGRYLVAKLHSTYIIFGPSQATEIQGSDAYLYRTLRPNEVSDI
jgi:hypothetical protein